MTAEDEEPFLHNVASVWTYGEGRDMLVYWQCQCGWRPRGSQPVRLRQGQTPHQSLRESHFVHVRKSRKREKHDSAG